MLKKTNNDTKENNNTKNTITKFIEKNKKIILGVSIVLIILIVSLTICFVKKNNVIITIDNIQYTEEDFNMYAYLVKYEYFFASTGISSLFNINLVNLLIAKSGLCSGP